jgi:hypothetical protein
VHFDDPYPGAEAIAQAGPFDGILAVADRQASLAAIVAEKLGLPYNSPASVEAARNKFVARQRFLAAGLPVPQFFRMDIDQHPAEASAQAPYPCVLKPLGLSASRGVIRADNPAEFVAAFQRIKALLARPEIVELLINCWCNADQWIVGRWVVMPDPPPFVLRACDFPTRSAQVMDAILAERKHPALATFCQEAHLAKRGFRPPTSRWRKLPPKMALSLEKLDPAGIGSKTGGLALSR